MRARDREGGGERIFAAKTETSGGRNACLLTAQLRAEGERADC